MGTSAGQQPLIIFKPCAVYLSVSDLACSVKGSDGLTEHFDRVSKQGGIVAIDINMSAFQVLIVRSQQVRQEILVIFCLCKAVADAHQLGDNVISAVHRTAERSALVNIRIPDIVPHDFRAVS